MLQLEHLDSGELLLWAEVNRRLVRGGGGGGGPNLGGVVGSVIGGPAGAGVGQFIGDQPGGGKAGNQVLGGGGGGGGGGKGGTQGVAPNLSSLNQFNAALPGANTGIAANAAQEGGIASSYGGIAQNLDNLANPATWNQFTQQQLGQFDTQGNQLQQNTLSQLARSGITGTGASNALDANTTQIDAQKQALTGQLGQQGLQFSGNMLQGAGSALQGKSGALGQQNQMGNEQLQNLLANPSIQIAAAAAQNGGNIPGKGAGKGK